MYGIEILFAIGGADQNAAFRVHAVFVQIAVIESLEEAKQNRQQAARGLVHLVVIAVGYDGIDLLVNIQIQTCLVDEDDAIVDLVTELQNPIQSLLALSIVLVDNAFKGNMTTLERISISYTRMTLLSSAMIRAIDVFPVPGGPSNRSERGNGHV